MKEINISKTLTSIFKNPDLSKEPIFYTYIYLNPLKPGRFTHGDFVTFFYEPFYVGKGHGNRIISHMRQHNSNTHKNNTIKKILKNNQEPIVFKMQDGLTELCSLCFEMFLIKKIGRRNLKSGSLTNLTDGGEGVSGMIPNWSPDTIQKRANSNRGKVRSKKSRDNMSASQKIYNQTPGVSEEKAIKRANYYLTEAGDINRKKLSVKLTEYYKTPEGIESRKLISENNSKEGSKSMRKYNKLKRASDCLEELFKLIFLIHPISVLPLIPLQTYSSKSIKKFFSTEAGLVARSKISKSKIERDASMSKERREEINKILSDSHKGKRWIYNPKTKQSMQVNECVLDSYISSNEWLRGRCFN